MQIHFQTLLEQSPLANVKANAHSARDVRWPSRSEIDISCSPSMLRWRVCVDNIGLSRNDGPAVPGNYLNGPPGLGAYGQAAALLAAPRQFRMSLNDSEDMVGLWRGRTDATCMRRPPHWAPAAAGALRTFHVNPEASSQTPRIPASAGHRLERSGDRS